MPKRKRNDSTVVNEEQTNISAAVTTEFADEIEIVPTTEQVVTPITNITNEIDGGHILRIPQPSSAWESKFGFHRRNVPNQRDPVNVNVQIGSVAGFNITANKEMQFATASTYSRDRTIRV